MPVQQAQNTQQNGFAVYVEQRPAGLVGRLVITIHHLVGLLFGGAFAFVRQKKALGEAKTLEMLLLRFGLIFVWPFLNKQLIRQPFPVQFRRRLEMLGSTYIKLGQILSLRQDILPQSVTTELRNLLSDLPPVDPEIIFSIVAEELGRPPEDIFAEVDPIPLGSASIMWACGFSCPLKAKLPGGAFVAFRGPRVPASFWTSLGGPSRPSDRTGSTATEPPK